MADQTQKSLAQVIKKIPLFKGLSPTMIQRVLAICEPNSFAPESRLCKINSPSDQMFILLAGELAVITKDGLRVATILPISTVGEMGFITRQPCSATVEVVEPSQILVFQKGPFDALARSSADFQTSVYKNVIDILSKKLMNDNVRMRDYLLEKATFQGKIQLQSQQIEVAIDLLVEKAALDRGEAQSSIDERMVNRTPLILVVDDEEPIRRVFRELLSTFVVLEASNGKEALLIAEKEPPDLVITDIRMPKMDGLNLLKNLRELHEGIPVLATSGYVEEGEISEYEFDGFIEKPLKIDKFRELVDAAIAGGNQ